MYATDLAAFNPFSATQETSSGAFDTRGPQADIFATSIHDFVSPASPASSGTSYVGSQYHVPPSPTASRPYEQQRPRPTKTSESAWSAADSSRSNGGIALSEFWTHPVSSSFESQSGSSLSSNAQMLLHASTLFKNGVISAQEKGRIKDQVLQGNIAQVQQQYGTPALTPSIYAALGRPSRASIAVADGARKPSASSAAWSAVGDTLFVLDDGSTQPSRKIASFDMDDTLVMPKGGRTFAQSRDDWVWWHPAVPQKLKELHQDGYKLVIFTNQLGITKGKSRASDIQGKIQDLSAELGVPLQAFVAIDDDKWRKPSTAMWDHFVQHHNGGVSVDMQQSFYCGDAAGRPKSVDKRADHSCSDRKFARNVGLPFQIPETCFLGQPDASDFDWGSVDPTAVLDASQTNAYVGNLTSASQEMIICVGFPGSGKSTFTKRNLIPHGYVHVNQDTLKSKAACLKAAATALDQLRSVVIDNTNPSASVRAEYIELAQEREIPVRCFVFKTPLELAQHLNLFRESVFGVRHVPDIGYHMYKRNYAEPQLSEGFTEIKTINFVPQFDNPEHERLFKNRT